MRLQHVTPQRACRDMNGQSSILQFATQRCSTTAIPTTDWPRLEVEARAAGPGALCPTTTSLARSRQVFPNGRSDAPKGKFSKGIDALSSAAAVRMGVDLCTYRARIGCFRNLRLDSQCCSPEAPCLLLRMAPCLLVRTAACLLVWMAISQLMLKLAGDVEENPGPRQQ
ncbi:hypothetical protein Bbelb_338740 [Branchiostoma belcheri]|nr:hypothetical protein Bbelb_338740 [Branchiostoma belcheri]